MINKEGKLFGKVSIIDILVVIVILATAVGIYARFSSAPTPVAETKTQKFTYVVKVEEVRHYTIDGLKNLGGMYDEDTKEYLGEIVDVMLVEPSPDTGVKSNGQTVETTVPHKFTALIKVETDGNVSDTGYYTSTNKFIGVGGELSFETKYVSTTGKIVKIQKD